MVYVLARAGDTGHQLAPAKKYWTLYLLYCDILFIFDLVVKESKGARSLDIDFNMSMSEPNP
jgi:hypothetical protein